MTTEQKQVLAFMMLAGQECPARPSMPSTAIRELRLRLVSEELCELADAFGMEIKITPGFHEPYAIEISPHTSQTSLVYAADATADLRVVVIGTDVAMGVDGEPVWNEVHRSNMSKFIDGHKRADGKWIKGPSYSPANLAAIIDAQTK